MRTGEMRNKQLTNKKNDITQGWGVLQSLISPSKGKERKEVITTRGIRFWSPSRYESRKTGLNFVERTTRGAVLVV